MRKLLLVAALLSVAILNAEEASSSSNAPMGGAQKAHWQQKGEHMKEMQQRRQERRQEMQQRRTVRRDEALKRIDQHLAKIEENQKHMSEMKTRLLERRSKIEKMDASKEVEDHDFMMQE